MFSPLAMVRISVHLLREDVPQASLLMAKFGLFHPEKSDSTEQLLPELPAEQYRELTASAKARFDKIVHHFDLRFDPPEAKDIKTMLAEQELQVLDEWLGELWSECSRCQEEVRSLIEERKHIDDLWKSLDRFDALDMDLGMFQSDKALLDLRIGTVPVKNLKRYEEALALAGYLLQVFFVSEDTAHVILAGLPKSGQEIETASELASYRQQEIPHEFQSHPEQVRAELQTRRDAITEKIESYQKSTQVHREKYYKDLKAASDKLTLAMAYAELSPTLRGRGGLCMVGGWVPKRNVSRLKDALNAEFSSRVVLDTREPGFDERQRVPSLIEHGAWLRPFAALVGNYGIPRYGEIDPTLLFSISFVLMFGMMFGDIGHGGVIIAAGLIWRRKLYGFMPFVVAIGLSSVLFGFLYGSLFGYEEVIHPLWQSPLSDPGLMLELAFYWGVGFILLATALTIRNRLAERHFKEALFDGKGLAGIGLYLGVLTGGYRWITLGKFGAMEALFMLIPLLIILGYHWQRVDAPVGEKILVVFIEGFETVMNYIANTLSFLRVAAFSLNHVALAVAVFALANMMDVMGHWITVVLGNLFILIVEGAIVAIQVLRLEYYEGFSRFFSGDGRPFRPLTVPVQNAHS